MSPPGWSIIHWDVVPVGHQGKLLGDTFRGDREAMPAVPHQPDGLAVRREETNLLGSIPRFGPGVSLLGPFELHRVAPGAGS